jgi:cephalosporin hydroxylase
MNRIDNLVERAMELGAIQVPSELRAFAAYVAELLPVNVLEIGSESGGTFYMWCRIASGMKISIDLPTGASGSGNYRDPAMLETREKNMHSWAPSVYVITGDSHSLEVVQQVRTILKDQKLDLLFIDGDHTYEGVKADYEMYEGFVKQGGVIAFHDIKDTQHHHILGCEVAKFWAEFSDYKKEFLSDEHWGGIGVIRKLNP